MKTHIHFAFAAAALIGPLSAPGIGGNGLAQAQSTGVLPRAELRCQTAISRASRQYFNQTMTARQECDVRRLQGRTADGVDCQAPRGEVDDAKTEEALQSAEQRLALRLSAGCQNVDLTLLNFPGVCATRPGANFDSNDLYACLRDDTNTIVGDLLSVVSPTFDGFYTPSANRCVRAVNERSRRMVHRELRARQQCLLLAAKGRAASSGVDCRQAIPPYGSGTSDNQTDSAVAAGYRSLLTKIPLSCAAANSRVLYSGNGCPDSTGGSFNTFDLQVCVFDGGRASANSLLRISNPREPTCGDGVINGTCSGDDNIVCTSDSDCIGSGTCDLEQCDSGAGNGNQPNACRADCTLPVCGDLIVDNASPYNEQCDAGDDNADDGPCISNCRIAVCGDGNTCARLSCTSGPDNGPEACDDSSESATCNGDCSPAFCGDAILNLTAGEECDDGFSENTGAPNACRPNCVLPECGDNVVDDRIGEECDPPEPGLCSSGCQFEQPPSCGDGVLNGACAGNLTITCTSSAECPGAAECLLEECDDGSANNSEAPNACRPDCTLPFCGDGIVDTEYSESCDQAGANADNAACRANCQTATCGDGFLCSASNCISGPAGGSEQCDDAGANSDTAPDACRTNCADAFCGDDVIDTNEQCDNGSSNSNTAPDACRLNCQNARCGDNVTDSNEECDNGPSNADNAACLAACVIAECGDGVLCSASDCATGPNGGPEQCDDATANGPNSPCRPICATAACGDGVICSEPGCSSGPGNGPEQCDEGAGNGPECSTQCGCLEGAEVTGCIETQCPNRGILTVYAGTLEQECTTNADCPIPDTAGGFCDQSTGRCRSQTRLDSGFTGIAHNSDITDQVRTAGFLSCPGPYDPESPEPCGECTVTGLRPEFGNCRCSNNIRTECFSPFADLDADSCTIGGVSCNVDDDCKVCSGDSSIPCATDNDCSSQNAGFCQTGLELASCIDGQCVGGCSCYFGPPLALSAGNAPACVLNRFAQNVSGTANVDLGEGLIQANLRSVVYLGETVTVPCPVCGGTCDAPGGSAGTPCIFDTDCDSSSGSGDGVCANFDPVAGDGERGGTCVLGRSGGESCDIMGINRSFPNPGGGGLSLDCAPSTGKNVSGTGLRINLATGTSEVSLNSNVPCSFFGSQRCPCAYCGNDRTATCSTNADCDEGVTCGTLSFQAPQPDNCSGECVPTEENPLNGVCVGDFSKFCDGALKSNGEPFVSCLTDADCINTDCGPQSCGTCTAQIQKRCFLPTITAVGSPNQEFPIGASVFCIAETSSSGINGVAGLPGPGRVLNQARSQTFCAGAPDVEYIPGVGGCPAE